ncbi:ABC transporter ATP-binding protein [Leptospira kobayashii]|uniref:ABC transporter ATP-binding protein n=2 Tax=Leptospira kobayashii TaxID=1917830 RepID=A0ABM7UK49_9LEPT|nr:ABC transporter ATP-binding protein [Leptospira kobayashii]
MLVSPISRFFPSLKGRKYFQEFWALKGINLEIKKGDSIGVLGRNGAGKSTLLQIIAGTLSPSEGDIDVQGKINALLELGSGFNPEFTGRENVFLNGSILGFSENQILNKFQEIEEFAQIGTFIDQPVKTYSSGMFVRLAFAVQALLEPEILIVDEALSVGDVFFQQKCHTLIEGLLNKGNTTFLFVTHDTGSVVKYCSKAIVLKEGEIFYEGDSTKASYIYYKIDSFKNVQMVNEYIEKIENANSGLNQNLRTDGKNSSVEIENWPSDSEFVFPANIKVNEVGLGEIELKSYIIKNHKGIATSQLTTGEEVTFYFKFKVNKKILRPCFAIFINTKENVTVYSKYDFQFKVNQGKADYLLPGDVVSVCYRLKLNLLPLEYSFGIVAGALPENELLNIESISMSRFSENLKYIYAATLDTLQVQNQNESLFLPFMGLCDLPGEFENHIIRNGELIK